MPQHAHLYLVLCILAPHTASMSGDPEVARATSRGYDYNQCKNLGADYKPVYHKYTGEFIRCEIPRSYQKQIERERFERECSESGGNIFTDTETGEDYCHTESDDY